MQQWCVMCLAGLSIEDIEDLYLFRTMVTGFLLIGAGPGFSKIEERKPHKASRYDVSDGKGCEFSDCAY